MEEDNAVVQQQAGDLPRSRGGRQGSDPTEPPPASPASSESHHLQSDQAVLGTEKPERV